MPLGDGLRVCGCGVEVAGGSGDANCATLVRKLGCAGVDGSMGTSTTEQWLRKLQWRGSRMALSVNGEVGLCKS